MTAHTTISFLSPDKPCKILTGSEVSAVRKVSSNEASGRPHFGMNILNFAYAHKMRQRTVEITDIRRISVTGWQDNLLILEHVQHYVIKLYGYFIVARFGRLEIFGKRPFGRAIVGIAFINRPAQDICLCDVGMRLAFTKLSNFSALFTLSLPNREE